MWFLKNALIFLVHLLPLISGQEFESTVIILKYEKGTIFHSGLCTGSQLDKYGVVTQKDCFNSSSNLHAAVGISRLSDDYHEVRFFKSGVFFEGWTVLKTGRPFTWQANFESRPKRRKIKESSCFFDMVIHEAFSNGDPKKGNLMCDKELAGIFCPSGEKWVVRQIYSNFTVCATRNNEKCKDGRLQEKKFTEFENKNFRKQIKLDLSRQHPDRFRNRLIQMNNDDMIFLGYHMYRYHHMYVEEENQGKPVNRAIHVRFNFESIKALGIGSRDYSAYRVKRLIASTPTLSNVSQPEINFRTNPDETLTSSSVVILDSAITPPRGISNDDFQLIRSTEDLKKSLDDIVFSTKSPLENSTLDSNDIPIRTSKYHDQVETSDKGKGELSATPEPETTDHGKVGESDLTNSRSARKEEYTSAVAEDYARKLDSTSDATDIPLQSNHSTEGEDGAEIRESGIPISRTENYMLGNISAEKDITTANPRSVLETVNEQIENSSKVRERGIPISRSAATNANMELSDDYRKEMISAGGSDDTDYGERGIPSSRLVTNRSSLTAGTMQMENHLQRNGTKRNTLYRLTHKDKRAEDGDIDVMYRDGKVDEEEEKCFPSSAGGESTAADLSSRARSPDFHPTLTLLAFIIRLFLASSRDAF